MIWYRKAADTGDADSTKMIGVMYEFGRGVAKDPQQAAAWYQKAADLGDADAKKRLAQLRTTTAP
jgi:TPR repeat protein